MTTSSEEVDDVWHPADFLLRGEYCSSDAVTAQLERYRSRYGFQMIAVFTSTRTPRPQPPVLFTAQIDGDTPYAGELESQLATKQFQESLASAVFSDRQFISRQLEQTAASLRSQCGWAGPANHVTLHTPRNMSLNQPVRAVIATVSSSPTTTLSQKRVELLASMLVTHIDVRQTIDTVALTPLDDSLLIPQIDDRGALDLETMVSRANEIVRAQTSCSVCSVVWRTIPSEGATGLALGSETSQLLSEVAAIGKITRPTLLAEIFDVRFARQYPAAESVVLVAPVPGVLAAPNSPAAGILIASRDGTAQFSSHEISLVRAVCLRLAVVRASAASNEVAQIVAEMDRSPTSELKISVPDEKLESTSDALPFADDLASAMQGMQRILDRIARNTNSHSATVRVATCRVDVDEAHGLVLQRISQLPEPEGRPLDLQYQSSSGVNWRTVTSGLINCVDDVRQDLDYCETRPLTRSQLSVPIRASGFLIGTLNLESPTHNNYNTFLPYVETVAGAIGRRIANANIGITQPILERAAEILDRTHLYRARLDQLREGAGRLDLPTGTLDQVDTYIAECHALIDVATVSEPEPIDCHTTIRWVLDTAVKSVGVIGLKVDTVAATDELELELGPDAAGQLLTVLQSVLYNVRRHSGMSSSRVLSSTIRPKLTARTTQWDGGAYLALNVLNSTAKLMELSTSSGVYRIPIKSEAGRLRVGAYLAGLKIRQVGGTIFFSIDSHGIARTVILIPVPTKGADKHE